MSTTTLAPRGAIAEPSPTRSAQRERAHERRRWSLVAAATTAVLLVTALVWAITWFQPARPATLVLLGAGYQENLAVPHNAYGWQSLTDLAQHGDHSSGWQFDLLHVAEPPRVLRRDTNWNELIVAGREPTVVVYISAHGAADLEGAYLLADDTTGAPAERLRLSAVLDRLAKLPSRTNKLLVLDTTQIVSDWRIGILQNQFARALTELEPRIAAIPRLVVLSSSGVDQQSAVCEEWRRTVFAHYFLEALHGDAVDLDGNRRVSVSELQSSVDAKLRTWSAAHRRLTQQTLLLPHGHEGARRARQIELAITDHGFKPEASHLADSFTPPAELRATWQRYETALQALPTVLAIDPGLWRQYESTLLRHEELICAGDDAHAAALREKLSLLHERLTASHLAPPASLQNSLAIYTLTNSPALPDDVASRVLAALWDADANAQTQTWSAALAACPSDANSASLLRIAIFTQLVERASENPPANLARASQVASLVASPLHPLPVEVQFMSMLARYLPPAALQEDGGARIGRALALRQLAEAAAVAHIGEASPVAAEVAPWIADAVAAADAQRRLGEDLLFGESADRQQADQYFSAAEQGYRQALENARLVRQALETRNRVLAHLLYYSQWLTTGALARGQSDAQQQASLARIEDLWRDAHDLAAMLAVVDPAKIDRAPLPTVENPAPRSLIELQTKLSSEMDALVQQYHTTVKSIASGDTAADWHVVQPALGVPHGDWRSRMKLLVLKHAFMRQILDSNREQQHAASPTTSAPSAAQEQSAKALAHGQGRVALATLGRWLFAQSRAIDRESYDQIRHRLDVFEVEAQWWQSILTASHQINERYRELPAHINAPLEQLADASPTEARTALATTERLVRLIDASQAEQLTISQSLVAQRVRVCDLATVLAERTLADRWFDLLPQSEPYFRRAGLAYLSDAQQLYPQSPGIAPLRDELLNAGGLALAAPAKLDVTTECRLQLNFTLTADGRDPSTAVQQGFPVAWLTTGEGLRLVNPQAGQRIVRRLDHAKLAGDIAFAIDSPLLDAAEASPPSGPSTATTQLALHGFFRGQVLEADVPVTLHLRPEITVQQPPLPQAAAVSLAAPASLQAQFGDGSGAVAIVLDASGSMGPPRRSGSNSTTTNTTPTAPASKYAEATTALNEVLQQLPAGTKVSLWMFGQAVGAGHTAASAESTIRQVQTPIVWNPSDPSQLANLMAQIDPKKITPWNESPIVRTILAAKTDLVDAQGFKTIVVITDGMDNRFAQDRVANPNKQSISETLAAEFEGSGISLNIVGFKIVSAEQEHAREQFEIVEKLFPPGRFYRVSQAEALAQTLRLALRQRLRFTLKGDDNEQAVAPQELGKLGVTDVWPVSPILPGNYRLQTNIGSAVTANLSLARGDVLSLGLTPTTSGYAVERRQCSASDYPGRPSAESSGWRCTVLQNQLAAGSQLRAAIALEQPGDDNPARLAQITPRNVWFELGSPATVSWRRMLGWTMPVWSVDAVNWPQAADGLRAASPQLRVWWDLDNAPLAAMVSRGSDRPTVADLAGVALQSADETVSIASIACEDHVVTQTSGQRTSQPCLVVRLQHTPGKVYWAELLGMQTAGVERRFYPSIGATTCLFWPVNSDEVDRTLTGVGIVSLDAVKEDAERSGCTLQLTNLPPPDANSVLPTPAYSLETPAP